MTIHSPHNIRFHHSNLPDSIKQYYDPENKRDPADNPRCFWNPNEPCTIYLDFSDGRSKATFHFRNDKWLIQGQIE